MSERTDFLWTEKYRPQTIDDCILPDHIKATFKEFVDKGEIPNLLLAGHLVLAKLPLPRLFVTRSVLTITSSMVLMRDAS